MARWRDSAWKCFGCCVECGGTISEVAQLGGLSGDCCGSTNWPRTSGLGAQARAGGRARSIVGRRRCARSVAVCVRPAAGAARSHCRVFDVLSRRQPAPWAARPWSPARRARARAPAAGQAEAPRWSRWPTCPQVLAPSRCGRSSASWARSTSCASSRRSEYRGTAGPRPFRRGEARGPVEPSVEDPRPRQAEAEHEHLSDVSVMFLLLTLLTHHHFTLGT